MSNELTLSKRRELTPSTWNMIQAMAPAMHAARFFDIVNPEQAMAIMIKGYELGLGLASSFEFIKTIQGKPTLTPMGALALIQNSPHCAGLKIEDIKDEHGNPQACRVWMKRTNGFEYTVEFSMEDATRAGLVKPDSGWDKYPANMLRWRAIGFCADVVFPDVIGGLKRADEFGADISPNGEVIDGSWEIRVTTQPKATLEELIERHGAEAILNANDGIIPATADDIARVAYILESNNGQTDHH